MLSRLFAVLAIGFAVLSAEAADTYRWEDETGTVHYSDQPPPPGARNVTRTLRRNGVPIETLPYRLQVAVKKAPVSLYVTDCGDPCSRARELLVERGVPHTLLDADLAEVRNALMALTAGESVVPVASVGKTVLKGFETGQWNAALDAAGYPAYAMIEVTPYTPSMENESVSIESTSDDAASDDTVSEDILVDPIESETVDQAGAAGGRGEGAVESQESN